MDIYEYWIGENIDPTDTWDAYLSGRGYMDKFRQTRVHVIQITFEAQAKELPLFNMEAVYKTLKAYYYELKRQTMSADEFNQAGPLYLYEINRGSGIWTLLAELPYLLLYGTTLTKENIVSTKLENLDKKLKILKEHFRDNVREDLFDSFLNAKTPRQINSAIKRLHEQRVLKIEVSRIPFTGDKEIQKDILAKEIIVFLKLIGVSVLITLISIFVISEMNSDNLSGLTNTSDPGLVIKANQNSEIRKNVPKVFIYSVLLLTLGRYVVKGITWADNRSKSKDNKVE